jgi:hypothetical protein
VSDGPRLVNGYLVEGVARIQAGANQTAKATVTSVMPITGYSCTHTGGGGAGGEVRGHGCAGDQSSRYKDLSTSTLPWMYSEGVRPYREVLTDLSDSHGWYHACWSPMVCPFCPLGRPVSEDDDSARHDGTTGARPATSLAAGTGGDNRAWHLSIESISGWRVMR